MKRKVTLALAVLAVAALCALGGVCLTYPIQLDQATLPGYLADFYDRAAARPCRHRSRYMTNWSWAGETITCLRWGPI